MRHLLTTLLLLVATMLPAQAIEVKNPFIWADTPDPDIIRVGDYYYLITTTMHLFPGEYRHAQP